MSCCLIRSGQDAGRPYHVLALGSVFRSISYNWEMYRWKEDRGRSSQPVSAGFFTILIRLLRLVPHLPLLWSKSSFRRRKVFDAAFYLRKYPDVAAAKAHPWLHYLKHGAAEGRKPHPLFQPDYYLSRCPEARSPGTDPLSHFLEAQSGNWASPHPLFDCESYFAANPEVAAQGINPLVHYLRSGRGESSSTEGGYFGAE